MNLLIELLIEMLNEMLKTEMFEKPEIFSNI